MKTTRVPIIAGNWKLNKTIAQARELAGAVKAYAGGETACEVVIAPVATALASVAEVLRGSAVGLAAQDCYWEDEGAFTGEIGPTLLKDAGCTHCIIGHSERRQLFGETNISVRDKVAAVLQHGLVPIMCVGETLKQREAGKTLDIVLGQVEAGLAGLDAVGLAPLVVAYEPVWAIGTGLTAKPQDAQEVHAAIRDSLADLKGEPWAHGVRILYGGSVKPANAAELLAEPDIDGALVGGASLTPDAFTPIIDAGVARAKS